MSQTSPQVATTDDSYQVPAFEVISLDCEISAYAPDESDDDAGGLPLF